MSTPPPGRTAGMTTNRDGEQVLEHSIEIDASPTRVWELVSDVRRMPEWSPQVRSTRLRQGHDSIKLGAEFTNLNGQGDLKWTTHGEIVRFAPGREVAFRIVENFAIWSFRLDPTDQGGTRLVQRRDTPDGISDLSLELTEGFLGGQAAFTQSLHAGMEQTLQRIKDAAEA